LKGASGGGTINDAQVGRLSSQSQQTMFSGRFISSLSSALICSCVNGDMVTLSIVVCVGLVLRCSGLLFLSASISPYQGSYYGEKPTSSVDADNAAKNAEVSINGKTQ
jgi:hypothetical protein